MEIRPNKWLERAMLVAFFAIVIWPSASKADSPGLELGASTILASYHDTDTTEYNERHPGLFLHAGPVVIGRFRNSEDRWSNAIGYSGRLARWRSTDLGVTLMVATGYEDADLRGMIALTARGPIYRRLAWQAGFIPAELADEPNGIFAGLYYGLGRRP